MFLELSIPGRFPILLLTMWMTACAASGQQTPAPPDPQSGNSENKPGVSVEGAISTEPLTGAQTDNPQGIADSKRQEATKNPSDADKNSTRSAIPENKAGTENNRNRYSAGAITRTKRTGKLQHTSLSEVSGMSVSLKTPGVLFAINDSGNSASIYAFSEQGENLGEWQVKARNRDWEDMSSIWLDGRAYLVIGDTGDNLKLHGQSALYLVEEPLPGIDTESTLTPDITLKFTYEDGARNVEAFAVADKSIFLISKEPVTPDGPAASNLYELALPTRFNNKSLIARKVNSLAIPRANFEARLAASMAGVDLNHITAMDIDVANNTAYLLSYRHVIRIKKTADQSWADALSKPGKRIYSHDLEQAEALSVATNRAVWFTSEKRPAPLWAIPISPPL